MSDANRTALAIVKETVPGTTPATPAFKALRITGAQMNAAPKFVDSKELRADRQITDLIKVGSEAGGQLPFEISHLAQDDLFEGALFNDWFARFPAIQNVTVDTPITGVSASTDTYTLSAGGNWSVGDLVRATGFPDDVNNGIFLALAGSNATNLVTANGRADNAVVPIGARLKVVGASGTLIQGPGSLGGIPASITNLKKGEWIRVGGLDATNKFAAGNGWCRCSADQSGATVALDVVPAGWAAETKPAVYLFVGEWIRNGVIDKSWTVEVQMQDLAAPEFHYFTGQKMGVLNIKSDAQAVLVGSVTLVGMGAADPDITRFAGATDVLAPNFSVLNTSNNAGQVKESGVRVAGPNYVMSSEINIDNTTRRQNAQATDGSIGIGVGRCMVTGKLNTYYGNRTLLTKLRGGKATSYDVVYTQGDDDVGREALLVDLPRIKFSSGDPSVTGVDTDRMLDMAFQAYRHPVLGHTIHVQKFEGFMGSY